MLTNLYKKGYGAAASFYHIRPPHKAGRLWAPDLQGITHYETQTDTFINAQHSYIKPNFNA
jgi:hypothetical protein